MTTATSYRAEEIAETFALIKTVHPNKLALPAVHMVSGRLIRYPMSDAIVNSVGSEKINAALLDMLHNSTCPHVAAFIQALSDQYTEENESELSYYDGFRYE